MEGEKEFDIEQGRFNATGLILLFYTFPIIALTSYAWWAREGWHIWVLGLFLAAFGTYFIASSLYSWSAQIPSSINSEPEVSLPPVAPIPLQTDSRVQELEQQVQAYSQMVEDWKAQAYNHEENASQTLKEHAEMQGQLDALVEEYEQYKVEAQHLIEEERKLQEQQRHTLVEQKNTIEEKQQQILQLETKVKDLNFEIKTLLKLAEKEGNTPKPKFEEDFSRQSEIVSGDEALTELKRCIDAAQRIVGMQGSKLGLEHSAIDLRRLFERMSEFKSGGVFVYSPQDKRVIFVNGAVKEISGLQPEQFQQRINTWIESNSRWNDMMQPLSYRGELKLDLNLGNGLHLQGWLGLVPTGSFRNLVIGFCYKGQ